MRTLDRPEDENTAFGAPIKKPPMPEQHRKVNDSGTVRQAPDGRLYTHIPENQIANFGFMARYSRSNK